MTRFGKCAFTTGLAAIVGMAVSLGAAGNGGFDVRFGGAESGSDHEAWVQFEVSCSQGHSCGATNVEMDWDDGFFDDVSGPVSQTQYLEDEWFHEYAENGLYHGFWEADDNLGNWEAHSIDFNIVN